MSELTQELDRLIQKAALDGALTQQAVDQFHAVLKQNDSLLNENRQLKDDNKKFDERVTELASQYNQHMLDLDEWAKREQELKDREESCMRKEVEAEFNEKRVQDHKEMFSTVFKGLHMRKQVVTPASTTVDQYGTRQSDMPDTTPITEEE